MSTSIWAAALSLTVVVAMAAQTPPPAPAPQNSGGVELKEGDKAPDFSLPGTDDKTHTLAGYKGRTVVLAWFPAAFTSG
jgi:hypothetical protein